MAPISLKEQRSTMVAAVGGAAASLVFGVAPLPIFLVAAAGGGILGR